MDYGIASRVALVTGASRGIGRAVALALGREGARVGLAARDTAALGEVATLIAAAGGSAAALPADLSDPASAPALLGRAQAALGGEVTLLVASHGSFTPMAKVHSLDDETVRAALQLDLAATLALLRAATPAMMSARFGRVVLVGSASAQLGQGKAPLYCALKAGLEGLVRNLCIDFTRFGVTANLVAPGFVETERLRQRADAERLEQLRAATSARALATPEQIAEVVAFLCSRAAGYVSGAVIPVTGGAHLANLW